MKVYCFFTVFVFAIAYSISNHLGDTHDDLMHGFVAILVSSSLIFSAKVAHYRPFGKTVISVITCGMSIKLYEYGITYSLLMLLTGVTALFAFYYIAKQPIFEKIMIREIDDE